jgi:hypothetical protein
VKKSLKVRIVAAIALTIIVFWSISGFLARKHVASFFAEHTHRVEQQGNKGEVLDQLRREKPSLFRELAGIRFLVAAAAIHTCTLVLGLMRRRRVSRPMALLSQRIHEMRLGTWKQPLPVDQDDEMGKLMREFNDLGPELSFTPHQYAAGSELAAMALIGHRVVRRTKAAGNGCSQFPRLYRNFPSMSDSRGSQLNLSDRWRTNWRRSPPSSTPSSKRNWRA